MTVEQFRKHGYLPHQWRRELQVNGILQAVIEVLEDAHPNRFPVHTDNDDDLSPTKAALQLGEARGYSKVINTIRILADPIRPQKDVGPPTYEPDQVRTVT
jgi:hypothetical protein